MKFITSWSVLPGATAEAVDKFFAGFGAPPEGVTLLGRWFKTDFSGGYSLLETDNAAALFEAAAVWADLLDIQTWAVIEDAEAGPVLSKVFKQ